MEEIVNEIKSLKQEVQYLSTRNNFMSDDIGEIASALAQAQREMNNAPKSADNPYFKSKYADLSEVTDAARVIHAFGLAYTQQIICQDGNRTLFTTLMHKSGQWIRSEYPVDAVSDKNKVVTPQAVGSAITYARRYSLQSILGIAAEDDDGNAASGKGSRSAEGGTHQQKRPALKKTPLDDMAKEIAQKMKDATKKEERAAILYTDEGSALLTKLANADKQGTVSRLKQIIEEGEE